MSYKKAPTTLTNCAEWTPILGKDSTAEWCLKCEGNAIMLINGQCIRLEELTEKSVCESLVTGGLCETCYEYEGPLSETKVWTCATCLNEGGVYTETAGSSDHF
jgi:hypothetical protein